MDERLKVYDSKMTKSFDALLRDYAAIRAGRARPICPVRAETKTMRNTHGIWRSWRICCGNTPTSRWISDG